MKSGAFIFLLAGLAMMQGAEAQGAARGRNVCAPTNAESASIAAIAAEPAAWMGRCVSVAGIYSSERLYADVDAIYGVSKSSIGGFVDGQGSMDGFWTSKFTGRVSDCAVAENELMTGLLRSPGISLNDRTLGCVKPEGPFLLFMSQGELMPAKLVRRLRKDVGADGGDLGPAPEGWPHLAAVQKVVGDFVAALRAGDRRALNGLVKNDYRTEQLIAAADTAIADLKKPGEKPLQVFVVRDPGGNGDVFKSEACFCRTRDCSKSWPIARRDADNQVTRPYACVRVDGARGSGETWTYEVDASRDFDGLPEP